MLRSQYYIQELKMKDFLIKTNKMMSTLKSFKPYGLILFLIKKTSFQLRKNKIKIYRVKLKCYILRSFFLQVLEGRDFVRDPISWYYSLFLH